MEVHLQSESHTDQVTNYLQNNVYEGSETRKICIISGDDVTVQSNNLWMSSSLIRTVIGSLLTNEDITLIMPDYSGADVTNAIKILRNHIDEDIIFNRNVKDILEALAVDITKTQFVNENFESKETIRRDLINELVNKRNEEDSSNIICKFCPKRFHGTRVKEKYKCHLGLMHFSAEMKMEIEKYFQADHKCSECGKIYVNSHLKRRHLAYNHSYLVDTIKSLIKEQVGRQKTKVEEDFNEDSNDSEVSGTSDAVDSGEYFENDDSGIQDQLLLCNQDLSDSDTDDDQVGSDAPNDGDSTNDEEAEGIQNELMLFNQNLSDSDSDDDDTNDVTDQDKSQDVDDEQFQDIHNTLLQEQDLEDSDDEPEHQDQSEDNKKDTFSISLVDHITAENSDKVKDYRNFIEKKDKYWYCKGCDYKHQSKTVIGLHAEVHVAGLTFRCKICTNPFNTRNNLRNHHYKKHTKNKKLQQKAEKNELDKEIDEKVSQIMVKVENSYVCMQCDKITPRKDHIIAHCETHLEGYSHGCHICKFETKTRNSLRIHISQKHKKQKR